MIEEAEKYIHSLGVYQARVRVSAQTARLEVLLKDFEKIIEIKIKLYRNLKNTVFCIYHLI